MSLGYEFRKFFCISHSRCKKCEIIDYMPVLVDDYGHYLGYDPKTNLLFLDGINHFNRFGKERIQIVYDRLAEEFEQRHIKEINKFNHRFNKKRS